MRQTPINILGAKEYAKRLLAGNRENNPNSSVQAVFTDYHNSMLTENDPFMFAEKFEVTAELYKLIPTDSRFNNFGEIILQLDKAANFNNPNVDDVKKIRIIAKDLWRIEQNSLKERLYKDRYDASLLHINTMIQDSEPRINSLARQMLEGAGMGDAKINEIMSRAPSDKAKMGALRLADDMLRKIAVVDKLQSQASRDILSQYIEHGGNPSKEICEIFSKGIKELQGQAGLVYKNRKLMVDPINSIRDKDLFDRLIVYGYRNPQYLEKALEMFSKPSKARAWANVPLYMASDLLGFFTTPSLKAKIALFTFVALPIMLFFPPLTLPLLIGVGVLTGFEVLINVVNVINKPFGWAKDLVILSTSDIDNPSTKPKLDITSLVRNNSPSAATVNTPSAVTAVDTSRTSAEALDLADNKRITINDNINSLNSGISDRKAPLTPAEADSKVARHSAQLMSDAFNNTKHSSPNVNVSGSPQAERLDGTLTNHVQNASNDAQRQTSTQSRTNTNQQTNLLPTTSTQPPSLEKQQSRALKIAQRTAASYDRGLNPDIAIPMPPPPARPSTNVERLNEQQQNSNQSAGRGTNS